MFIESMLDFIIYITLYTVYDIAVVCIKIKWFHVKEENKI